MALSMTGFGTGQITRQGWQCGVEIRAVNHRFLDIGLRLPTGFTPLENDCKKLIRHYCSRGKVDCTVVLTLEGGGDEPLQLNQTLARQYAKITQDFSNLTGIPVQVTLADLLKVKDLVQVAQPTSDQQLFASLIQEGLEDALKTLNVMRQREGESLLRDLGKRLQRCETLLGDVEKFAKTLPGLYQVRLRENLKALDGSFEFSPERVAQEVAIYADRSDITEEITRFRIHVGHMYEVLQQEREVGKRADFLLQELNREINTIASKSGNAPISQTAVEVKSELEKMREQIQNIE